MGINVHSKLKSARLNGITILRHYIDRGLAAVTRWVRFKYAAMNLKNWQIGVGTAPLFPKYYSYFCLNIQNPPVFTSRKQGFFDKLKGRVAKLPFLLYAFRVIGFSD